MNSNLRDKLLDQLIFGMSELQSDFVKNEWTDSQIFHLSVIGEYYAAIMKDIFEMKYSAWKDTLKEKKKPEQPVLPTLQETVLEAEQSNTQEYANQ